MLPILVVGEFASGKTTAVNFIRDFLRGEVVFNSDRLEYARGVREHLLKDGCLEEKTEEGRWVLKGELATAFLRPGEKLKSVPLDKLMFRVHDNTIPLEARKRLGLWILAGLEDQTFRLMEAAIGTNTNPEGDNPFSHTLADFVRIVGKVGVLPEYLRMMYLEAGFKTRSRRNQERPDPVPQTAFEQYAARGGGLSPALERGFRASGAAIVRIDNNQDDLLRLKEAVGLAFGKLCNSEGAVKFGMERRI